MSKAILIACKGATTLALDEIHPFQGSLKDLTKENYEKLRATILKLGYSAAIHVWKHKKKWACLDGHQRLRALRTMRSEGFTIPKLPVVIVEAKSYKEAKLKVLSLTSQYGDTKGQGLREFMDEADIELEEIEDFRFADLDHDDFKDEFFDEPDEEKLDENKEDYVSNKAKKRVQLGDIWELGDHRLMCGDCGDQKLIDRFCDERADLVFTDPPYNLASNAKLYAATAIPKSYGKLKDSKWDKNFDPNAFFQTCLEVLKKDASVYVCTSHFLAGAIWGWMATWAKLYNYTVWTKPNPMPSLSKRHWTWNTELICYATRGKHTFNFPKEGHALSAWEIQKNSRNDLHPTQKPVALAQHVLAHASIKGQVVWDFFGGSGTTLIACEKTGRRCRMIEIAPEFCDVILERYESLFEKKASLFWRAKTPAKQARSRRACSG